jgi:Ser/Thr protein kinase RdoA (MazF antagonist)
MIVMNLETINQVLENYLVGHAISYQELPITTSGNISYSVVTQDGEYVLRTLLRQTAESAISEYEVQKRLNAHDITTPLYIPNSKGEVVTKAGEFNFALSTRVPGLKQNDDTVDLARDMGRTLARIHDALDNDELTFNSQQWFNPRNISAQLESYTGPDKDFISQQTTTYSTILEKGLPKALTHGDFHTNNIFSQNDHVTAVFDFESAEYTVRILDLARLYLTYIKVTGLDGDEVLTAIHNGYNSAAQLKLTDAELGEFKNACIFVALVSLVSIYNHGNIGSSQKYLEIVKNLIKNK